jgi:hypothetical protein
MKSKHALLFSLVLMMPLALSAASTNSSKVTFDETVIVGGTQVPAGDYRVQWEGTGSSVEVSIIQGKKVIASAPATLVHERSPYGEEAVQVSPGDRVLRGIKWSHQSLNFDQAGGPSTATDNTNK